jgi:hypothetical protein
MKTVNDRYILFSMILVVFLFLSVTQTLTSGFHLVDDHEIIKIKYDLKEASLGAVIKSWVKEDMNSINRFRPLYFANRVLMTRVFGSDFFFWSLYNGFLWCITLVFFYIGIRNLRFNIFESIIFLVISFIGPQTEIWWRLGPQESLGVTLLSAAFFFLSLGINRRLYHLNNIFFCLFLILASLCKESFILIIPAFIVLKLWTEIVIMKRTFKCTMLSNLILLVPLVIALLELIFIKYRIGTFYSGISGAPAVVFNNIWHTCLDFIKNYLNLVITCVILLVSGLLIRKRIFWFDLPGFVFFILILLPNILLYAKTGLDDCYLLPTSVGLAFFITSCLKDVADNSLRYRKVTYVLILISFIPHLIGVVNDASRFETEGKDTNKLLEAITSGYEKGTQVVVVADPVISYEASVSLKVYLYFENGIDLYGYPVMPDGGNKEIQGSVDEWKSYFAGRLFENLISNPGMIIFLDSKLTEKFFQKGPLTITEYEPLESGSYTYSLFRKKSI